VAAANTHEQGSGVLDAIEGLAFEIEHVQMRVRALELRMDAQEADPGPELVARKLSGPEHAVGPGWQRFERRAERLVRQLRDLESTAATAARMRSTPV
jgi:heme oxygenase